MNIVQLPCEIQEKIFDTCDLKPLRLTCRSMLNLIDSRRTQLAGKAAAEALFQTVIKNGASLKMLKKQIRWIRCDEEKKILLEAVNGCVKSRFYSRNGPSAAHQAIAVSYRLSQDLESVKKWLCRSDPWMNVRILYEAGRFASKEEHLEELDRLIEKNHQQFGTGIHSEFNCHLAPLYFAEKKWRNGERKLPEDYHQAKRAVLKMNPCMHGGKRAVKKLVNVLLHYRFYDEAICFLRETCVKKRIKNTLFYLIAREAAKEEKHLAAEKAVSCFTADYLRVQCWTDQARSLAKQGKREKASQLIAAAEKAASEAKNLDELAKLYPVLGKVQLEPADKLKARYLEEENPKMTACLALKGLKYERTFYSPARKTIVEMHLNDAIGNNILPFKDYLLALFAEKAVKRSEIDFVQQEIKKKPRSFSTLRMKAFGRTLAKERIQDPEVLFKRIGSNRHFSKFRVLNALLESLESKG